MGKAKKTVKNDFVDFLLEDEAAPDDTSAIEDRHELSHATEIIATDVEISDALAMPSEYEKNPPVVNEKTKKSDTAIVQHMAEGKVEQARALKIAQEKLNELEAANSKLEFEVSELRSSGEVLYKHKEDLKTEIDEWKHKVSSLRESYRSEIEHLEAKLSSKNKEVDDYKIKIESLDLQLKVDFQKIKSRERELENRIQIMKLENQALIRSKDELILELKRNLDEINLDIENFKDKGRDLHMSYEHSKERMRKSVKALRLAINLLDNEDDEHDSKEDKKPA